MLTALRSTFAKSAHRTASASSTAENVPSKALAISSPPSSDAAAWQPPVSDGHGKGHFERVHDGLLFGWACEADGRRLSRKATLWIDGKAVTSVGPEELTHRDDLAAAGIGEGTAAFGIDVTSFLSASATDVKAALSLPDSKGSPSYFACQTLRLRDRRPLNFNPMMHVEASDRLEGWTLDYDRDIGLRLDRFRISSELHDYADRYTRLAFVDKRTSNPTTMRCPIELTRAPEAGLELGILLRCDRPTPIVCRLLREEELVSELRFQGEASWRYNRKELPETAGLDPDPSIRYSLEIEVEHKGRGYVDVAVCGIAEELSAHYLRRVYRVPEERGVKMESPVAVRSFLTNGGFQYWSRGMDFSDLQSGQELADGWFFEGRKSQLASVAVSMDSVPRNRDGGTPAGHPGLGIRVRTDLIESPVRVCTPLDMGLLDADRVTIELSLHALEGSNVGEAKRIFLFARGAAGDEVVHVIARRLRVRGHSSVEHTLSEVDMVRLRQRCARGGLLHLACEFGPNSDLLLDSADVRSTPADADLLRAGALAQESNLIEFEDPAIRDQLQLLKGLKSWRNEPGREDANIVVASHEHRRRSQATDIDDIRVATAYRPYRNYPSVDIVVPIYNALEAVRECVRSVLENTDVPYTLICVDDGSDEPTATYLAQVAARFPNVVLIVNEENIGYTRTVNRGLRRSNSDYICVLNSDCIVTPGWLAQLIDCASTQPDVGMVGPLSNAASYQSVPRIRDESGDWSFNPLPCSMTPADMAELVKEHSAKAWPSVRVINGFCQLIRRDALDVVGFLDEESFPRGFGEENDFCARIVDAGFKIHIADDTYVFHSKSQSFGHKTRKELSKEGSAALKKKHPRIDWKEITREIEFDPAIVQLRSRVVAGGI